MNYFVTGGHGVIGSRLVDSLRKRGDDVVVIDRKLDPFGEQMNVDVTRFEELWGFFKDNKVDYVIHLAGEVGRMVGELRPNRMLYVNLIGTMNLVQLCLDCGAKFVLFSTSEVYGNLHDMRLREDLEDHIRFKPTNIYAMSKLFAESVTRHYCENYGLQALRIRPFMVYGPGEFPGYYRSAMSNFIYKALVGHKMVVHKNAVRSWTYVDDFIEGVLLACQKGDFESCASYNIGSDKPKSMEEVAHIILGIVGNSGSYIEMQDAPTKFSSLVKLGSFEKAERELGFVAKTPLEVGIQRTVDWQREYVLGDRET